MFTCFFPLKIISKVDLYITWKQNFGFHVTQKQLVFMLPNCYNFGAILGGGKVSLKIWFITISVSYVEELQ